MEKEVDQKPVPARYAHEWAQQDKARKALYEVVYTIREKHPKMFPANLYDMDTAVGRNAILGLVNGIGREGLPAVDYLNRLSAEEMDAAAKKMAVYFGVYDEERDKG